MEHSLEQLLDRLERMNPAIRDIFFDKKMNGIWPDFVHSINQFADQDWLLTYITALALARVILHSPAINLSFIGGFAVYAVINRHYNVPPFKWRGSTDIDILSEKDIIPIIKDWFVSVTKEQQFKGQITRWLIGLDKRTLEDDIQYEPISTRIPLDIWIPNPTRMYFDEDIDEQFWNKNQQTVIDDVCIITAHISQLVHLKDNISIPREKDIYDLYTLLFITEQQNISVKLSREKAELLLRKYDHYAKKRVEIPSRDYLQQFLH